MRTATGGKQLGIRTETLEELAAPAIPATHGFYDECMKAELEFSLGFMKTNPGFPLEIPARSAYLSGLAYFQVNARKPRFDIERDDSLRVLMVRHIVEN